MASYEAAGESDEWYTPLYIFDALCVTFDLDVAAPRDGPRYVPARSWYHADSLQWLAKFFEHGNGIALVPDRTSAPWFQEFAPRADAILWVTPKIKFERPDGSIGEWPGTGTALLAAGIRAKRALISSGLGFVTETVKRTALVG